MTFEETKKSGYICYLRNLNINDEWFNAGYDWEPAKIQESIKCTNFGNDWLRLMCDRSDSENTKQVVAVFKNRKTSQYVQFLINCYELFVQYDPYSGLRCNYVRVYYKDKRDLIYIIKKFLA